MAEREPVAAAEPFYAGAVNARRLARAMAVTGLDQDIAALRALLYERMKAQPPEKLADIIRCFVALVRAVSVAHGLSPAESAAISEQTRMVLGEFARGLAAGVEEEVEHV